MPRSDNNVIFVDVYLHGDFFTLCIRKSMVDSIRIHAEEEGFYGISFEVDGRSYGVNNSFKRRDRAKDWVMRNFFNEG